MFRFVFREQWGSVEMMLVRNIMEFAIKSMILNLWDLQSTMAVSDTTATIFLAFIVLYQTDTPKLCYYYVTHAYHSEPTLYSCLNVKNSWLKSRCRHLNFRYTIRIASLIKFCGYSGEYKTF